MALNAKFSICFFDPNGTNRANRHAYNVEIDNAWSYLDMRCAQVDTQFAYMDTNHQRQRARRVTQAARQERETADRERERRERLERRGLPRAEWRGWRAGVQDGMEAGYDAAMRNVQMMGHQGMVGGRSFPSTPGSL
ncbi:MAG: hypothetical protein Q9203_003306 [Teloschistes exilis]